VKVRLQKLLADSGFGSRRSNEALIIAGRVQLNGRVARLGDKADPAVDRVTVDGKILHFESLIYIMLNKPKGVLSSTEDELEEGRETVRDLVGVPGHLYPVGRLDRQSEGLILLTNDGDLAHRLTHPRYEHVKVYDVVVEGQPSEKTLSRWAAGIELDGKMTAPVNLRVIEKRKDETRLRIEMREGRKRQIRRTASLLDHPVKSLVRIQIGPLRMNDLPPGSWRYLTDDEVAALKQAAARPARRPTPNEARHAG
jgi:pseudouridine synthase